MPLETPGILRAIGRSLLPVRMPLSKHYWRWLWLALAFKLLVGAPLFIALVPLYALAQGIILGCDHLGGLIGRVYAGCYHADLKRTGWTPPERRSPRPVRINPDGRRSA